MRAKAREIERSIGELEHTLQRSPTEKVAEYMETDVETIQNDLAEISQLGIAALDQTVGSGDATVTLKDLVTDPSGVSPEAAFQAEETRRILVDSINRLPDRERLVVTLYYYEGLTLAEIGEVLGVTESRVCQIHAKTVMSLRNRLAEPPIL